MRDTPQRRATMPWPGGIPLARALVVPLLSIGFAIVFWDRIAATDLEKLRAALRSIAAHQWAIAVGLTALSYWALGRYDAICHMILRSAQPRIDARRAGMAALAVSQTLGMGIFTGAIARWRLLPSLSPTRALALSTFVAISFMAIWGWMALAALAWHPAMTPTLIMVSQVLFLGLSASGLSVALWPGGLPRRIRRFLRVRGIGLRSLGGMILFAALDMLAAAAVVHILLPPAAALPLASFVPAFLIALGLGLLSGTPAGLGAFELTLLALLPTVDPAHLLAAITGYRAVYFVLPSLLAMGIMAQPELILVKLRPAPLAVRKTTRLGLFSAELDGALVSAPQAEANLARQPGMGLLWSSTQQCGGVVGVAGRSLVLLRDPFPATRAADVVTGMATLAREQGQTPCYYKCSARTAVLARRQGFEVVRLAREAWLDPARYDITDRTHRQLRRKLRNASKNGLRFEHVAPDALPITQMHRINQAWAIQQGGERGFSMGRYHPALLAHQRVYLAWHGARLVGFVTFHVCDTEWALDLLRPEPGACDGAAHGLIDFALTDAAANGVPRLSLAAAPLETLDDLYDTDSPIARLRIRLARRTGGTGLLQFKGMFAPNWDTLYITAPSRFALLRAGAEIARAISSPQPMPRTTQQSEPHSQTL